MKVRSVQSPWHRAKLMMFCADKDVQERAKALLCLPAMSELELPAVPGRPAQRLMEKLGMEIEALAA